MPAWMHCESLDLPRSVIALLRQGGAMKKDDEFLKQLMLEMEASEEWVHHIDCDEDDPEAMKRYYHALLLADAGALAVTGRDLDHFRIRDQGYDLLSVMRDEKAWKIVRTAASKAGEVGAKTLMSMAEGYIRSKLASLGFPID